MKWLWCKFLKWLIKMGTTTYDLSGCCPQCSGVTPGDAFSNCATDTTPANMTVDTASELTGASCGEDGIVCPQNTIVFGPCHWIGAPTVASQPSAVDVTITTSGGHYFLQVTLTYAGGSSVYKKDLGTSAPNCSAFDDDVPYDSNSGAPSLCTLTQGSVHVTSGP